jgi:hypothetical protein
MATRLHLDVLESRSVPAVFGYSVSSDNESDDLFRIDMETGDAVDVGPVGFPSVEALAFQPGTGVLFGVDDSLDQLVTIDLATGAGTLVGDLGLDVSDVGLSFDPAGNLFLSSDGEQNLYAVDPATGAATLVGPLGQPVTGLTYGQGTLFGLGGDDFDSLFDNLVRIDAATGAATPVGPLGLSVDDGGLDFDETGVLWGLRDSFEEVQIFTIDPATGAATIVATTLGGFESLAIAAPVLPDAPPPPPGEEPPPEPAPLDPCDGSVRDVGVVQALFCKILEREVDPESLDGYNRRLAGGESVASVADEIWNSPEHRHLQARAYFQTLLGREPTGEEEAQHAIYLSKHGEQEYLAEFFGSDLYRAEHSGDDAWLAGVYEFALGREPDAGAQAYLADLSSGARSHKDVAREILQSDESEARFLRDAYSKYLERGAGGGEIESYHLATEAFSFHDLAIGILGSQEFIDLAT